MTEPIYEAPDDRSIFEHQERVERCRVAVERIIDIADKEPEIVPFIRRLLERTMKERVK